MGNETAIGDLLRLEAAHSALGDPYLASGLLAIVVTVAGLFAAFLVRDSIKYGLDRPGRVMATVCGSVLVAGLCFLPGVLASDHRERASALATLEDGSLCARVLDSVADGDIRYMERASVHAVSARCGREEFLVAANSTGSTLSVDARNFLWAAR